MSLPATKISPMSSPQDLAKYLEKKNLIDGKLVSPQSGAYFKVLNPATMETVCEMPQSGASDVESAILSAEKAQKAWKEVSAEKRGRLISQCADLLEAHQEELAQLMTLETGKAIRTESRLEAGVFANSFRYYAGLAMEIKGETIPHSPTTLTMTVREPIGVVGAIIPWNVPLLLMALKVAPALVAGNSIVVKSSEEAPLAVLRAAELINSILPAGLLNMISGDGPGTGAILATHPKIAKLTFTGSVETGKIVYGLSAQKLAPVTLELGGKSPMIICEDVDVDKVVQGAVTSMRFTRQGQSCTAASRIFIHATIFDAFLEKLKAKVNALKMGNPFDETTDIGTIISPAQYEKVLKYIEIGKLASGAKAHTCSQLPEKAPFSKGLYIQPVLFTGLSNDHQLAQEEIFGPVTCLIPWKSFEDVIQMANDSEYGLAATIWTNDLCKALNAVHQLEAGFVQVNQNNVVMPGLSYGGFKSSGLGKEASFEAMIDHFTRKKTIIMNLRS
ncbi:Aldehyde dehydrogenase family protein [Candidatus Bealeia paramacronuclearis]|uniref:Aldehyde dehydrogenase family protein n=1 Tax=Candidatus Bealeia paramacronuclearis TaxID=1921001 RepID=A0ABZ2C5L9_9PROT|nr:Aldehyde dehydrogenase family protein [Candidatus Bealeia paramacronuclearis]